MSRFKNLAGPVPALAVAPASIAQGAAPGRQGLKNVSGFFSPELSAALHILAIKRGMSLQAVMGEAFDDLLRKHGEHPFGER